MGALLSMHGQLHTLHDINLLVLAPLHNPTTQQTNGRCRQLLQSNLL